MGQRYYSPQEDPNYRVGSANRDPYSGRRTPGEHNEFGQPMGSGHDGPAGTPMATWRDMFPDAKPQSIAPTTTPAAPTAPTPLPAFNPFSMATYGAQTAAQQIARSAPAPVAPAQQQWDSRHVYVTPTVNGSPGRVIDDGSQAYSAQGIGQRNGFYDPSRDASNSAGYQRDGVMIDPYTSKPQTGQDVARNIEQRYGSAPSAPGTGHYIGDENGNRTAEVSTTPAASPGANWQQQVTSKYPDIGKAGTAANAAFVAAFKAHNDPAQAMATAERVMRGGSTSAPAPTVAQANQDSYDRAPMPSVGAANRDSYPPRVDPMDTASRADAARRGVQYVPPVTPKVVAPVVPFDYAAQAASAAAGTKSQAGIQPRPVEPPPSIAPATSVYATSAGSLGAGASAKPAGTGQVASLAPRFQLPGSPFNDPYEPPVTPITKRGYTSPYKTAQTSY